MFITYHCCLFLILQEALLSMSRQSRVIIFRFSGKTQWHVSEALKKLALASTYVVNICINSKLNVINKWCKNSTQDTLSMKLFVVRTLYLFIDWLSIFLKRGDWGRASILNSFWLDTVRSSSCHDALGKTPYSQTSNPSHSVFTMAACRN